MFVNDDKEPQDAICSSLLLSKLKPLLEQHWHSSFDESSSGYLNEDGAFVRFKKMKHLLASLVRWRAQRQAWRKTQGHQPSAIDDAISNVLELKTSSSHNDLVLHCTKIVDFDAEKCEVQHAVCSENAAPRCNYDEIDRTPSGSMICVLDDVSQLRCSSAELCVRLEPEVFDDPFEPPPQMPWKYCTLQPGEISTGCVTPLSSLESGGSSSLSSGTATPAQYAGHSTGYFGMWFPVLTPTVALMDATVIPNGIVQTRRSRFESTKGI